MNQYLVILLTVLLFQLGLNPCFSASPLDDPDGSMEGTPPGWDSFDLPGQGAAAAPTDSTQAAPPPDLGLGPIGGGARPGDAPPKKTLQPRRGGSGSPTMDSPSAQPDPTLDDSVGAPRQPRQPLAQPPAQPTLPVVADTAEPDETTQVRDSMRSLIDPNHPFYQLRLDSEPIDPNSKITGKPLTICEMLESVSSPQTRCQLLHAYWALAGEIAKYKIAMFRQVQLSKWVREIGSTDAKLPIFQAAEKQAIAQCQSLELRVILKQNELASLLKQTGYYKPVVQANQAGAEPLPIPDDLPFVKVYTTHVNQLAQYRPASNLILLDKTITLRKQIFESKFQEFAASEELFNAIQDASLKSQASVESLILAHSQYLAAYGECTDAIIEYNDSIADYVAQTVGPEITGRRLLATLIHLNPEPADNPADSVPVVE